MDKTKPTLALLVVLLISFTAFSQTTIWEEDFGVYPDETVVGTANRWTLTTTPLFINTFPGTPSHFWTLANEFHIRNTLGLEQVFTTETIDISAFSNISVSVNVTEVGNNTNTDYVNLTIF